MPSLPSTTTPTPPLEVSPGPSANFPLPVAKSAPILARPQLPTVPTLSPAATSPAARPPSGPISRGTTSTLPPMSPPTPAAPLTPTRTAEMRLPSTPEDAPLPVPLTKKSASLLPVSETLIRPSTSGPLPPAGVAPSNGISAPPPAKKSSGLNPPVEPLLRKSARLFQPPLPGGTEPAAPAALEPSVIAPLAVASLAPPVQDVPAKRSSRIILASDPAREATPFSKTPPPMTVVPPLSTSGRLRAAASGTSTSDQPENAARMDTSPQDETVGASGTNLPTDYGKPTAPPQVKPLTARLDKPTPPMPEIPGRVSSGTAQIDPPPAPGRASLAPNTVAPPRRTKSVPLDSVLPPGTAGSPSTPPPVARPVLPGVISSTPTVPPPVTPAIKPVAPPLGSAVPATPPPASPTIRPVIPAGGAPAAVPSAKPSIRPTLPTAGGATPPPGPTIVKPVVPVTAPPAGSPVKPVVVPVAGVKPVLPGAPAPVSAVKPVVPPGPAAQLKPGAPAMVTPVVPVSAVRPVTPGAVIPGAPLKPAAAVPVVQPEVSKKTGTAAVKTAPPKETARITVKPSLPTARPAGGNLGGIKPVVAVGAAAAMAAAATPPATTPGAVTPAVATPAAVTAKKTDTVPVAPMPVAYTEERSTLVTTVLAGCLALLTWGIAGYLFTNYHWGS